MITATQRATMQQIKKINRSFKRQLRPDIVVWRPAPSTAAATRDKEQEFLTDAQYNLISNLGLELANQHAPELVAAVVRGHGGTGEISALSSAQAGRVVRTLEKMREIVGEVESR